MEGTTVVHITTNLEEAHQYFLRKALDDAEVKAYFVLQQAQETNNDTIIYHAAILLSQILSTKGKYSGKNEFLDQALEFIRLAENTSDKLEYANANRIALQLGQGHIYANLKDFDKALSHFEEALLLSKTHNFSIFQKEALIALVDIYIDQSNLERAKQISQQALISINASNENDKKEMLAAAKIYDRITKIAIKKHDFVKILEFGNKALSISKKFNDIEIELSSLNNLSVAYGVRSDYKKAMELSLEALEKSKSIQYRFRTAHCLINMATIYAHLFNYHEALQRYQTVLQDYQDILPKDTLVVVFNNAGNIHYSQGEYLKAKQYFSRALEFAKSCSYKEMIAHSLAQLSRTYTALKKYDIALINAKKADNFFETLGDINGKQINLINLGDIHARLGRRKQAIQLISRGIATAKRMKDDVCELSGYQLLAEIFTETEDYKQALKYQVLYNKIQAAFSKTRRNRQVMNLEIKYAIKEKQQRIEQLTKENEYQALLLEKSQKIATQNEQLVQINEELKQFANVVSHDLKEPLRMISSYSQLIKNEVIESLSQDGLTHMGYISEGVERLNHLLDALLQYTIIGQHQIEKDPVNLNEVVEACRLNLKVLIEETNTSIVTDTLPIIPANDSLLIQLFQNLLSNAIKFRKPDVDPLIHIAAKENEKDWVIGIKDNGIGLASKYKKLIFVIFQRLHPKQKYKGTGIGLAICQKIIQQLGGEIWVDSQQNNGSIFYISIPK